MRECSQPGRRSGLRSSREAGGARDRMMDGDDQGSTILDPALQRGAAPPRSGLQRFLGELQRRRVPRAAVAYLIASFGALQGLQVLMAAFGWGNWVLTGAVVLAFVGFPLNLVAAWFVDVVPPGGGSPARRGGGWAPERRVVLQKPTWAAIAGMAVVVAGLAAWRFMSR